jgi:membrane dipeptidase
VLLVLAGAWAGWRLAGRSREAAHEPAAGAQEKTPAPAELAMESLVVDTHIDLPWRLDQQGDRPDDVSRRTARGDFDAVRAKEGGLDVAWMSIYVPAEYQKGDGAKSYADGLIDLVVALAERHPGLFALATSADEAERIAGEGRIALPMGMENGAGIEDDLDNLAHFHRRGIRYVTLTHGEDNLICDSSYSKPESRRWHGLSPFGREVIGEMNRLGILVDLSHVSDQAFDQAIAVTRAPPIASHSSCRHFTPGFERNLDDERIRALARKGGVLMVNFGSGFVTAAANAWSTTAWEAEERFVAETGAKEGTAQLDEWKETYKREHPFPRATVADVADHVEHVIAIAGIDHVGIGSDFDGVGDTLPTGLEDVSKYPNLFAELRRRGRTEEEIGKIAGGNLMRVWREAERISLALGGPPPAASNAEADAAAPDVRPARLD